ncbi:hypothetical protein [Streptantibioticus silvisoli]|uniref:DUF2637 domain-containing protein n=1 Tax=Streptantibioticus silvisoli TaxID=2705255 RepID=A0ABT6W273_9ACTN|nr:hypothetical protein [Streptantibioticus silvisoli]MDI5964842.1 hypothetical protein [Streptantibioticus silvisoli]
MSDWSEERRRNKAADAEQTRKDADAAAARRAKSRREEDERRRANAQADKAQARAEKLQERRDKANRRRERAAAWSKATTPGLIYRRGTLALVTASALGSLPAQIAHFAGISLMLLPLPFALEGAAWVMAAGVAYADERHLPGWVRWMLRGFCLAAAGFAAYINYGYGAAEASAAGYGLAAVSLLGPMFFEVRQWVGTLSESAVTPEAKAEVKAREAHAKKRANDHKDVVALADRLVSAAPFGTLSPEDAFAQAWEIKNGTRLPGMTPALHVQAAQSRVSLAASLAAVDTKKHGISPEAAAVELFLADTFTPGGEDGDGTATSGPQTSPQGPGGVDSQAAPGKPLKRLTTLIGKGKRAVSEDDERPLAEDDLTKVRALADELGGAHKLSATNVRKCIGCRTAYASRLRDAVKAEQQQ